MKNFRETKTDETHVDIMLIHGQHIVSTHLPHCFPQKITSLSLGQTSDQGKSASKQVDSVLEVLHSMCPSAKVEHVVSPRREEMDD